MFLRFLFSAAALAFATWVVPGIKVTASEPQNQFLAILAVAAIFGIVNALVKPLFAFASAPLLLITLGLFLLVINALMLWLTAWVAEQLHLGWQVDGFWSAFWGALIVSIVSFILNSSFTSRSEVNR
ncbi:phage holin family protein [Micropruina sonneratiae]|uniref:phage holin family protein n=1 Tax=Micropruina sonneratiae TaxID=2986940 RepID=UPI002226E3F1|nr:phage holin family protein [Micropruina sp. KQZ13P-5]MCW3159177.1 phage holin family protein [Micropruina sp. KQZ13P-5]